MSKETIYRRLRRDRRAGGQIWRCLRILSKFGRKHRGSPATRGRLIGKRHISQRPAAVQRRRQIGHWEGDTVSGDHHRPFVGERIVNRRFPIGRIAAVKHLLELDTHRREWRTVSWPARGEAAHGFT